MTVAYVLSATPADEVWLVPVWKHAFSKDESLIDYEHRSRMAALAMAPFGDRVRVLDIERRMGGTSRTIDTVERLRAEHADVDLLLVLGTDLFAERHQWKEFPRLEREVPFVVIGRQGAVPPPGVPTSPPLPDVSSSGIRGRLRAGEAPTTELPSSVLRYIEANGLYRPAEGVNPA
jgi:nicotinate-nucleotide adenylyltransferase